MRLIIKCVRNPHSATLVISTYFYDLFVCSSDWGLVEEADNRSDSGSAGPLLTGDSSTPDIEEGEEESTGIFQLIDKLEDLTDRLINRYEVQN
jgi:hypothetical protein